MAIGQGSRVALGASYFIVVARALHPDGLGAFAGAVALVALAAPFASLGAGNLMIKHVARDPRHFRRYWGGALSTTIISGVVLGAIILACSRLVLPKTIPLGVVACVMAADLLFSRILDISGQAYQAHERLSRTAQFPLMISVSRLIAAGLFILIGNPSPVRWAMWYLGSSALSATISVLVTWKELGRPERVIGYPASELREGMYFATSLSAQNIYNDIDKSMLARLSTLEATGIYSAAYRLIDVSFVPVRARCSRRPIRDSSSRAHAVRAPVSRCRASCCHSRARTRRAPAWCCIFWHHSSPGSSARIIARVSGQSACSPSFHCSRPFTTSPPTRSQGPDTRGAGHSYR